MVKKLDEVEKDLRATFSEQVKTWRDNLLARTSTLEPEEAAYIFNQEVNNTTDKGFRDPVALKGLSSCSPISVDLFDAFRFAQATRGNTLLGDLISDEVVSYKPTLPLALGAYSGLYNPSAKPNDDMPGFAWDATHKKVCGEMLELPEFKELTKVTKFNPITSAAALGALIPTVVALAKEEQEEEEKSDGDNGDGDGEGEGNGEGNGKGEGGEGKEEAKKNKRVEALTKAIEEAKEAADNIGEAAAGCGFGSNPDSNVDPAPFMELADAFNDESVKRMVDALGRLGKTACAVSKATIQGYAGRGYKFSLGDDITKLPDGSIAELATPLLRKQMLMALCSGEAPQRTGKEKAPAGRGPVVVCLDCSGSMFFNAYRGGDTYTMAAAVTLATIKAAKQFNRATYVIQFSGSAEGFDTRNAHELAKMINRKDGGGTSFEAALTSAQDAIKKHKRLRDSDILFITDGEASVGNEYKKRFLEWKRQKGVRVFLVAIGEANRGYGEEGLDWAADHSIKLNSRASSGDDLEQVFIPFWETLGATATTDKEHEKNTKAPGNKQ